MIVFISNIGISVETVQLNNEMYDLKNNYISVSSDDPQVKLNSKITRVFGILEDGTWMEISVNDYYDNQLSRELVISSELGELVNSKSYLDDASAVSGTTEVSSDDSIGLFDSNLTLITKIISSKQMKSNKIPLYLHSKIDENAQSILLKNKITFEVSQEKTIRYYFRYYIMTDRLTDSLYQIKPTSSTNGFVGYLEVRSN